jgi:hypothetical protein
LKWYYFLKFWNNNILVQLQLTYNSSNETMITSSYKANQNKLESLIPSKSNVEGQGKNSLIQPAKLAMWIMRMRLSHIK